MVDFQLQNSIRGYQKEKTGVSANGLCACVLSDTKAACKKEISSITSLNFQPIFKIVSEIVINDP